MTKVWTAGERRALAALLFTALSLASSAAKSAPHVRVHASASLDAHASRSGERVLFRGKLADEAGRPLSGRTVTVVVSEGALVRVPIEPCPGAGAGEWRCSGTAGCDAVAERARQGAGSIETDPGGHFCVQTLASAERLTAHFEWPGTPLIDPTMADVVSDPSLRQVELRRSDRDPVVIDLASESFTLVLTAVLIDEGPNAPADGLPLVLSNEAGTEMARATTAATGEARFTVSPPRSLGSPGRGELRVDLAPGATTGPAARGLSLLHRVVEIERRVEVRLTSPETVSPGDPEDGVTIPIQVTTATGTPVSTGIVEASVEGRAVGSVAVADGRADLVVTFPSEGPAAEIRIRYAGEAPWFSSGQDLTVRLPIETRTPWRRAPLLVASLAVVLWLAIGRTRRPVATPAGAPPSKPATGVPRLDVVRVSSDPRVGWTGRVIDAHETVGVRGAEVRVERPSFAGVEVLASTEANDAGRFELRCDSAKRGDRLVVSSPLHSTLQRDLPRFGEVEIALILRRRALLDRFVAWARRRGAPFDAALEPTPGQVARMAHRDSNMAAWAQAVERVGFGPGEVDEAAEEGVDRLAPQLGRQVAQQGGPGKR